MNNHSESGTKPKNPACQQWGLKRTITPCFGARLVQEGNRLHFLADRAGLMVPLATMTRCTWIRPFR